MYRNFGQPAMGSSWGMNDVPATSWLKYEKVRGEAKMDGSYTHTHTHTYKKYEYSSRLIEFKGEGVGVTQLVLYLALKLADTVSGPYMSLPPSLSQRVVFSSLLHPHDTIDLELLPFFPTYCFLSTDTLLRNSQNVPIAPFGSSTCKYFILFLLFLSHTFPRYTHSY